MKKNIFNFFVLLFVVGIIGTLLLALLETIMGPVFLYFSCAFTVLIGGAYVFYCQIKNVKKWKIYLK